MSRKMYRANVHMRRVDEIRKGPAWQPFGRFKNYTDKRREQYLEDSDVYYNEYDAARALACALIAIAKVKSDAARKTLDAADAIMAQYGLDPETPFCPAVH